MQTSLDFANTEQAFRQVSDAQLYASYRLFKLFQIPSLVVAGPLVAEKFLRWHVPFVRPFVKGIFRHFCAGENLTECLSRVAALRAHGVGSILDFATENMQDETALDETAAETIRNIEFASSNPGIPFCVFKPSGMIRFELLEKVSANDILSAGERLEWQRGLARIERVADLALKKNIPLLVDAEESWVQPAIDDFVLSLMRRCNQERPLIYQTVQMYRHDRLLYINQLLKTAYQGGFIVAVKLVRGAYMEKERARAFRLRYASPIYPDKTHTDQAYNEALNVLLDAWPRVALCAGTHNEYSTNLLVQMMGQKGIAKDDRRLTFSQLYGMSDNITNILAHAGYQVAKYLPYGKLEHLLPYLARRARENSAIAGQSSRELALLQKELLRRKKIRP